MEIQLLGSVAVYAGGQPIELGGPRQRTVFAALAMDAAQHVPTDVLINRVWGQQPPAQARNALYVYISRLRDALSVVNDATPTGVEVQHRSNGYAIDGVAAYLDCRRLRDAVARARRPDCADAERVAVLSAAARSWTGTPLADLDGDWVGQARAELRELQHEAILLWSRAQLRLENAGEIVAPLTRLVADHPLTEPLVAVLMRALAATGRPADALAQYDALRHRLIEELGVDPGPELVRLHLEILRADPPRDHPPVSRRPPAQLPLGVPTFRGRSAELRRLDELSATASHSPTAVVISAVLGMAGVGKTALAVHWARRAAAAFPDGQLYVDLQGFDPTGRPVSPGDALRTFIEALGVPPPQVPEDPAARTGLYRTLLTGRRVLVLLDNARDAEHVRPLLPGSPGSLVLVTSRNQLPGLIATDAAVPLTVDRLDDPDARRLLVAFVGDARAAAERDAVEEIITVCAGLPLALTIVAARAAMRPRLSLGLLAGELLNARDRLDVLSAGDPRADVRTVFSWSYSSLSPAAARQFRLLALHPGPAVSWSAAVSIAGGSPAAVRGTLAELTRAHLVSEVSPARFVMHDLVRVYADELASTLDSEDERRQARHRLLDHYLGAARAADALLRAEAAGGPADDPGAPPTFGLRTADQAQAWFADEHTALLTTFDRAVEDGLDAEACQLAAAMATWLDRSSRWRDLAHTQDRAVHAATRLGDAAILRRTLRGLARADSRLNRHHDARRHLLDALTVRRDEDDPIGAGNTLSDLATVHAALGDHGLALRNVLDALALFETAGDLAGQARSLNGIGWYHAQLGQYRSTLRFCHRALVLLRAAGDTFGEADTWDSLGFAHYHLRGYRAALACYRRALGLFEALGDNYQAALTLDHLGDALRRDNDQPAACDAWRRAARLLDELDAGAAEPVRRKLRGYEAVAPG